MPARISRLRSLTLTPDQYAKVAYVALGALTAIVLTGAAVRMTGSGLGCPDWPKCYGRTIAPLESHAVIEYGNRLITGLVGLAAIAAGALAWRRRPFRWHLALFGALLPVGVVCQIILGALVVKYHLAPGLVMSHYLLSMFIIDAAFTLAWLATYESDDRPRSRDRLGVWSVRVLVPLGQLTILFGTISTASGPHAGEHEGQVVHRFDFKGGETLAYMVNRHGFMAAVFGVAALAVWVLLQRDNGERRALRPMTVLLGLLAAQGLLGIVQYQLELPAELVWLHVALATATWIAVLWSVARAGRLEPVPSRRPAPARAG